MKYTDETTIEDIAEYALEHWDAFMQDVRGQKLKKWLLTEMHEDGLAQLMEEQLHSDWTMLQEFLKFFKRWQIRRRQVFLRALYLSIKRRLRKRNKNSVGLTIMSSVLKMESL